jgi:hypothetical protein
VEILMGRAPAIVAAALLGACTVEVDGAPCTAPGTTSECPGGQACGNDRRCSARALACAASRCTPGVGGDCLADPVGLGTGTTHARRCSEVDPVCGAWVVDACASQGRLCGKRSGGARCECPTTTARDLTVTPAGALTNALPFATGAASPPGCAFRTITDALVRARELRVLDPSSAVTVTVTGVAAGETYAFSGTRGERFPLVVPDNVALRSDGPAGGGTYEILLDAASATSAAVVLESSSTLQGFTVRNVDRESSTVAIDVPCAVSGTPPFVSRVIVEGRGDSGARLGIGLRALPCSVVSTDLEVRNAAVAGVWASSFSASGGAVSGNGSGIVQSGGTLILDGVRVAGNAARGVEAFGSTAIVRNSRIVRNGDTGLVLRDLRAGTEIRGNTVWGNGATTNWGRSWLLRPAGGVVCAGASPPEPSGFLFSGNRIYANRGDQIIVAGPEATIWTLGSSTCADANVSGCYDKATPSADQASYRGIFAIDAQVDVFSAMWEPNTLSESNVGGQGPGLVGVLTTCPWSGPALDCASEDWPQ